MQELELNINTLISIIYFEQIVAFTAAPIKTLFSTFFYSAETKNTLP